MLKIEHNTIILIIVFYLYEKFNLKKSDKSVTFCVKLQYISYTRGEVTKRNIKAPAFTEFIGHPRITLTLVIVANHYFMILTSTDAIIINKDNRCVIRYIDSVFMRGFLLNE